MAFLLSPFGPEIRHNLGPFLHMSMTKASFCKGGRANQVGNPRERSVYSHFSYLQHLSHHSLSASSYFCGVLKLFPLHGKDIWTFWIRVWLYVAYVFSFKKRQIPSLLLMFILTGLVKFLLCMESFFPSKVNFWKFCWKHLCDISSILESSLLV